MLSIEFTDDIERRVTAAAKAAEHALDRMKAGERPIPLDEIVAKYGLAD